MSRQLNVADVKETQQQQQNNKEHWHFTVPGKDSAPFERQQPSREDAG